MSDSKPRVVYFGAEQAMVKRVESALSHSFDVTGVTGVTDLDDVLNVIRQIKPDYVLVDPRLPDLDHQQLHRQAKIDRELEEIQILTVSDGELNL